ncbi:MAG TPA: SpoIID/LytB domain-containing protein [Solirubrobacterales bacterium]|nr:SpoIID/LytB domain-containing protein [Solirubrobacterales bacterium]
MPRVRRQLLRALLPALLGAAALTAPPASGAVTWVVRGHGFGHGVGMSQYGAYGYAKHGKGVRFILAHYYTGTTLSQLPAPRAVRVLIDVSADDVGFSEATQACGKALDPSRSYEAHRVGGQVRLRSSAGRPLANCGAKLRASGEGHVELAGVGAYRGALEVVPTESNGSSLNAINALGVDQYVKGVIPNESPASWPMAALRAQAIASRSYALSVQVEGNGFDLYDDTSSQVYRGMDSETARSNEAADSTRGQVLTYQGEIAQTYFSACSGGHTESVQNVFFGPAIPYLTGVPDPYDYYCPLHSWVLRFSGPQMSARLGGYLDGRLKRVVVTKRGASPRIVWARLYGTGGVTKIRGDELESALGAYDSWMTFQKLTG